MTIDEIRELVNLVVDSGIAELEVQRDGSRVRIRRVLGARRENVSVSSASPAPQQEHPQLAVPAHYAAAAGAGPSKSAGSADPDDVMSDPSIFIVKSPIVGTFYECPSPGSPSFVQVGEKVHPGQVLCIIESMKLMNEIECETSGVIVKRFAENGQPVEYGESLFAIKPN
jgi:acetyl-CoA carboxylase biotin carboxyl carrier protein